MKEFIKEVAPFLSVIIMYIILTSSDRFTQATEYERDAIIISILVVGLLLLIFNIAKATEIIINKIDNTK